MGEVLSLLAVLFSAVLLILCLFVFDRYTLLFSAPLLLIFGKGWQKHMSEMWHYLFGFIPHKKKGASFQNPWEVKKVFSSSNKGLVIDGHHHRMTDSESFRHLALIAPTGMGKTTRYVIPNIFSLRNSSLVITDMKGELYNSTSGYLARNGYELQVLNLIGTSRGFCYNPLARIKKYGDIAEVAHIIIRSANPVDYEKQQLWYKGAETLLKVIISSLKGLQQPSHFNLVNVLRILQNMGHRKKFEDFLARYADETAWNQYKQLITGNEKMLQSFYAIAVNALDIFNDVDLARIFCFDSINFKALRNKKTALFIMIPPNRLKEYSVIINLIYTQLFNSLMAQIPDKNQKSVYVLGDEWGHTAIPNFAAISTTIRQYRVSLSIVLQSLSQLEENYGRHASQTIIEGGMASKLFYGGIASETGKRVEEMLGKQIIYNSEINNSYYREENLLNSDRVRTLGDNEALFISGNKEPVLFRNTQYCYDNPEFRSYMRIPPAPLPKIPREPIKVITL